MIHRLVAEAFISNPEDKREVNHKDGNRLNNCADNLEWVTRSENQIHSYKVLGRKSSLKHEPKKLNAEQAKEIFRADGTNADIARRYGVSDVLVGKIKRGKVWKEATCQSIV